MADFYIKKGKSINLKGPAVKDVLAVGLPKQVAILPSDFPSIKPNLVVKIDSYVKVGSPILCDRNHPEVVIGSPVSGKVIAINRGDKRVLLSIIIEADGKQDPEILPGYSKDQLSGLKREQVIEQLLKGGLWPVIRQRPFSKIANHSITPKSLFVRAMSTDPLSLDVDFVLNGKEEDFQYGLDVLKKLTNGKVHLCVSPDARSKALTQAKNVETHRFFGPHPAGNVSTHIHYVDPINKADAVWYVEAQDVLRIAKLFQHGVYSADRVVSVAGEGVQKKCYAKTVIGAPISVLLQGSNLQGKRCISGSVLSGTNIGPNGFVRFYDSQLTIIPEGGKREFLGWLSPGFNKFTLSNTFFSALDKNREASLDADKNGSDRAIVLNNVFDRYVALDVLTFFLIKAIGVGDIEECERLGILECDEEDFALAAFACPSKTDVCGIIRRGLDLVEKEA